MWCPTCRADVAAELSLDNRRMLCARCQTELGHAAGAVQNVSARTIEAERDARELLARWSTNHLLEPPAPKSAVDPISKSSAFTDSVTAKSPLRFDGPQRTAHVPSNPMLEAVRDASQPAPVLPIAQLGVNQSMAREIPWAAQVAKPVDSHAAIQPTSIPAQPRHDQARVDHDHVVREALHRPTNQRANWILLAGQVCAYLGVGLLTCGTVMVMWSYFGGPPRFMPNGWLAAAIGQMLLFLGVITLVSGGMEQTVSEVAWRIDHLAEEMHHMGLALDQFEHEFRQARMQHVINARNADGDGLKEAA